MSSLESNAPRRLLPPARCWREVTRSLSFASRGKKPKRISYTWHWTLEPFHASQIPVLSTSPTRQSSAPRSHLDRPLQNQGRRLLHPHPPSPPNPPHGPDPSQGHRDVHAGLLSGDPQDVGMQVTVRPPELAVAQHPYPHRKPGIPPRPELLLREHRHPYLRWDPRSVERSAGVGQELLVREPGRHAVGELAGQGVREDALGGLADADCCAGAGQEGLGEGLACAYRRAAGQDGERARV